MVAAAAGKRGKRQRERVVVVVVVAAAAGKRGKRQREREFLPPPNIWNLT